MRACSLGRGAGTWCLFESDASSGDTSVNARSDTSPIARCTTSVSVGSLAVCLGSAHISRSVHVGVHSWVELAEEGGVVQRSASRCSCVCSRVNSSVSGAEAGVNTWVSGVGNAGRMRAGFLEPHCCIQRRQG